MQYIGIDLHKQYFVATVMEEDGKVKRKDRVSTDRGAIREYFQTVNGSDSKATIEAGYNWGYFYDELREQVHEVKWLIH